MKGKITAFAVAFVATVLISTAGVKTVQAFSAALALNEATFVEALPVATRTSTVTGSAVDLVDYDGYVAFTLMSEAATAGTTPTLNVKVTHADTSGGSYSDVSGATWTEVTDAADAHETLVLDSSGLKRFVKIVGTIGGSATPTFAFGVNMTGFKDQR